MEIVDLKPEHLSDAVGLSQQAGWNQIKKDWQRLLAHPQSSCLAGVVNGQLVATTTVIRFDPDVYWVGMVLVDKEHRKQGYGTTIVKEGVETVLESGSIRIGLDATEHGEGVYRDIGFETVEETIRWRGTLNPTTSTENVEQIEGEFEPILDFDFDVCSVNREAVLRHLMQEDEVDVFAYMADGCQGYTIIRPGRNALQVGPIVAANRRITSSLLSAVAKTSDETVIVDAVSSDVHDDCLEEHGLTTFRNLKRMTYEQAQPILVDERLYGAIGLEWG